MMKGRAGLFFPILLFIAAHGWSAAGAAGAADWTPLGMSGGGGMFTASVSPHDPKLIFVNCDMGGAYRSEDGGRTWTMLHWAQLSSSTLCRPLFHPSDPNVVFAVSERFYRSTVKVSRDRGRTWRPLLAHPPWDKKRRIRELAADAANGEFLLVGLDEGAYATADGGKSWRRCEGLKGAVTGFHVDQTSPKERRICFASSSRGIFRSADGARTWKPSNQGLPLDHLARGEESGIPALGSSRAGWKYFSLAGGSNAQSGLVMLYVTAPSRLVEGKLSGGVYRSSDRAKHWVRATGQGINLDTKASDQWATGPVAQYAFPLTTNKKPRTVYVANSNTGTRPPHHTSVYCSDDAGKTWRAVFYSDPKFKKFNVEHDYRTINEGWNDQDPARFLSINPADPQMLLYTNDMRCYITTDGGKSWKASHARRAKGQGPLGPRQRWVCNGLVVTTTWHYRFDPFDPQRRYIAYTDIGFARSEDGGKTWRQGAPGVPWCGDGGGGGNMYDLAFDPAVRGKLWAGFGTHNDFPLRRRHLDPASRKGRGGVARSLDHGATWKPATRGLPPDAPVTSVELDPKSPPEARVLWAVSFGHGIYKSSDGGKRWVKKSKGLPENAKALNTYRVRRHPDGTLFCSITGLFEQGKFASGKNGGAGLYRSRDGGETWVWISRDLPARWILDFALDPKNSQVLYAASRRAGNDNGGLYKSTDGGRTWKLLARKGAEHFGVALHPKKPNWVYMTLAEDNPAEGLWLSKDGGATWTPFKHFPFHAPLRVSFDPADDSVIYVTTFGGSVWRGPAEPEGN